MQMQIQIQIQIQTHVQNQMKIWIQMPTWGIRHHEAYLDDNRKGHGWQMKSYISIILKLWTKQWLKKTSLCRRLPQRSGPSDVLWGHNSHGKESQEFEPERLSRYADFICMGGIMIQMAIMMKRIMITIIMTCLFAKDWLIASQRWISPDSLSTHSRGLDTSRTWFNILFSFLS